MDWTYLDDGGVGPVVIENNSGPGFWDFLDKVGSLAGNAWGAWNGSQSSIAQAQAAGQQSALLQQQQQAYAQQQAAAKQSNQTMMVYGFMGLLALAFLLRQTRQA